MRNDSSHDRHLVGGGQPDAIRAADADRDATAALLRKHHAAGRLADHELQDRLDQTMAARTLGELRTLMVDLPRPEPHPLARLGQAWRRGELVPRLIPTLVAFALVWGTIARQAAWHHHHYWYWHHRYYHAYYGGYHHHGGTWFPLLVLMVLWFLAFRLRPYPGRHGRGPGGRARWV